jgi:hypothetical protein
MARDLLAASAFWVGLFAGCSAPPPVPTPAPGTLDPTPPTLRLGSAGLRKDVLLTEDSAAAQTRRARSTDQVFFLATATDPETGVRRVGIRGELRITCVPPQGTNLVTIVDPIAELEEPQAGAMLPGQLARQFVLDVGAQRARCQHNRFADLRLEMYAETENGVGLTRQSPVAIVNSFGPDVLRVATFNLWRPGNHPDPIYASWGLALGAKADVLLLTEVEDRRRAELVAGAAGMPYVAVLRETDSDIAIASRAPLRNIQRRVIDPPGRLTSNDSNILSAETDIGGYPHTVVATHWGIKGANDVQYDGHQASPARLEAAQAILSLLPPAPAIAFVGGDLNAFSGFGPQDHDNNLATPDWIGGTPEVALLYTRLKDPFVVLQIPNAEHCSNGRGDYVLYAGAYAPVAYQACFPEDEPSDHPFVLVTFVPE